MTPTNDNKTNAAELREELIWLAKELPEDAIPVVIAHLNGLLTGRAIGFNAQKAG